MQVYHGSDIVVSQPKILPANRLLDFGEGFYTTSSREQARRWTRRVRERKNSKDQIISVYEYDAAGAEKKLRIIRFEAPTPEWLYFVAACRSGKGTDYEYDIATGPVANDNVYATVQLFETGLLSEAETITRLKVEKIYNQILFHTEESLHYCTFLRYENVEEQADG